MNSPKCSTVSESVHNNEIPTIEESTELLPQLQRLRRGVDNWQVDEAPIENKQITLRPYWWRSAHPSPKITTWKASRTDLGNFVKDNLPEGSGQSRPTP